MHITRLHIERVRNLKAVALHELQPFNVFYGQNGSGKTSTLTEVKKALTAKGYKVTKTTTTTSTAKTTIINKSDVYY